MGEVTQDRVARYVELIESPDTLEVIVQRVADGEGLPAICKAWDVPYGRVLTWLMADAERYKLYLRSLEVAAHGLVSETVKLADDVEADRDAVAKANLQVTTRFKVARHHAKELYGEKVEVKHSGNITFSHALQGIAARRLREKAQSEPRVIDVTPETQEQGDVL